jgi:hypothetical protein
MASLLDRILLGLRAMVNDAVSDVTRGTPGDAYRRASTPRDVERLLATAEKRLAQVQRDQADAVERERRTAAALHESNARMDELDREVDAALRGNQQEVARVKLDQLRRLRMETRELESQWRIHSTVGARLQQEAEDLRAQLDTIRTQLKERSGGGSERATTEPAATERAATERAATEPAATEPAATERAATERATNERMASAPEEATQVQPQVQRSHSAAPAPAPEAAQPKTAEGSPQSAEGLDNTRLADALQRMKKGE